MEPVVAMYTAEAEEELLGGSPDFVLDAIDNIDTKVGLSLCFWSGQWRRRVRVVVCQGHACRRLGASAPGA